MNCGQEGLLSRQAHTDVTRAVRVASSCPLDARTDRSGDRFRIDGDEGSTHSVTTSLRLPARPSLQGTFPVSWLAPQTAGRAEGGVVTELGKP